MLQGSGRRMKRKAAVWSLLCAGSVFLIAAFLLFLFLLFPQDLVKRAIEQGVDSRTHFVLKIHGAVKPVFPNGLQCEKADLNLPQAGITMPMQRVTFHLPLSAFFHPMQTIKATCFLRQGTMEAIFQGHLQPCRFRLQKLSLQGVFLDAIRPVALKSTIRGEISGEIAYRNVKETYDGHVTVRNGLVAFPDRGLPALDFRKMTGTFSWHAGKVLITDLQVQGRDFEAKLSGSMDFFADHPAMSPLRLSGDYSLSGTLATAFETTSRTDGRGRIAVSGSLANPQIAVPQ